MKPLLFILAAFFLLAPRMVDAREATSSARTYALLIGSNRAGSGQSRLLYAHGDARRMAETLTTLGGVAPAATSAVLDASAQMLEVDELWLESAQNRLAAADAMRQRAAVQMLA